LQARAAVVLGKLHFHPGGGTENLPGHGQQLWCLAPLDRATGIALQLIAPTFPQLATDRQEPAWNTLRIADRVPDVTGRRVEVPPCHDDLRGLPFSAGGTYLSASPADIGAGIGLCGHLTLH